MLYIEDTRYFIPSTMRDVAEVGESLGLNASQIRVYQKFYKLQHIPSLKEKNVLEFIKNPVAELLKHNPVQTEQVKYLIHVHTARVMTPFGCSLVREIKNQLGLFSCIAFGTSINNCASSLITLDVMSFLLESDVNAKAIIVCADVAFTPVLQLIPNSSILGDASAAILVSKQGQKNRLIAVATKTAGQYAKGIWLSEEENRDFEKDYLQCLADVIDNVLKKSDLSMTQIKIIFPHNVNAASWLNVLRKMNLSSEKIFLKNVSRFSHCFGADVFINYASAVEEDILQPGDFYLMATVGLGATFSAAVFQY